jgi:hypothetical protein
MGTSGSPEYRARRRERERQRRQQTRETTPKARPDRAAAHGHGPERRTAATACGWCGGPITPRSRGPIPKWCSATCRHRAWEQARAAASGLSAVELVERRVEVQVPLVPTRRDWARLIAELAAQLNDGRVYDRDLPRPGAGTATRTGGLPETRSPDRRPRCALTPGSRTSPVGRGPVA